MADQPVRVEQGSGLAACDNAENEAHSAAQGIQKIQALVSEMTASAWLGNAAGKFSQQVQTIHDDLQTQNNKLLGLIDSARNAINAHTHHDQSV
jgi:uncharacterized protein YukE